MPVIGLTGGIASGKSTFAGLLLRRLQAAFFDADACSRSLLQGDPEVIQAIRTAFGSDAIAPDGSANRGELRNLIFQDPRKREALEEILHPRIRKRWSALAQETRNPGSWLLVDIPLLYETGAASLFDGIIVVACSRRIQQQRLQSERALSAELAAQMIAAQQPVETKIAKADHLIWNESTYGCLSAQAEVIATLLPKRYA